LLSQKQICSALVRSKSGQQLHFNQPQSTLQTHFNIVLQLSITYVCRLRHAEY